MLPYNESIPTKEVSQRFVAALMTSPTLLSSTLNVLLSTLSVLGLKRSNESYRELNLALRLIPVIRFVPVDILTVAFDQLFEELAKKANCLELEESINEKRNSKKATSKGRQ